MSTTPTTPVTFSYNIIPGAGRGGKLVPTGSQATPTLQSGAALQVQVRWAGNPNNQPTALQGYIVITPLNGSDQALASPFVDARTGRFACLMVNPPVSAGGDGLYTFPVSTYLGGRQGRFELTIVIGDSTTDTMWSADPEFDTGS